LLNSINPFRLEGQKTIMCEMLDQRDWRAPDWVVLPGGNLGNVSAFGKGLREAQEIGLIDRLPRLAVIQAERAAPFYDLFKSTESQLHAVANPETLATAIRIEKVSEQEIADAKAIIGRCGIGCEPASAATLAGIRKLSGAGVMDREADVVAVLTGNLLKDPDYIFKYHTGRLEAPGGIKLQSTFGNQPVVVPNDPERIAGMLSPDS
jgi:threonine synthase